MPTDKQHPVLTDFNSLLQDSNDLLADLGNKTQLTTGLAILQKDELRAQIIAAVPSKGDHSYTPKIGCKIPLHCTAIGKALLARLPHDEKIQLLQSLKLEPLTPQTLPRKELLTRKLEIYRQQGYAEELEEFLAGINSVASCITDHKDVPIAAVFITGFKREFPAERTSALSHETQKTCGAIRQRILQRDQHSNSHYEAVRKAKEFIDSSYADESAIINYTAKVEMCSSWFRKCFKEQFGTTPTQYRNKLIFNKAKDLLRLTDLSVKEISIHLGFNSHYYFSRAFKNYVGFAPTQLRKSGLAPANSQQHPSFDSKVQQAC
ncbi:IclR family transcriptional regulator domain-containing protein [Pelagicoccus mobilis]|uniref:Helix-turn-helix domain-containing protein n=1 Tax=Pelagicoccus mobilis TaxID=415221 RepID=A0A934RU65_9BACT|nr:IclR family transcriptional regulator C-terminal domain-containing protein [Pelagicoccus mobilis]MBK1875475.1 helix-turn-helix domain-containing protein [Pelagicoccus mobilis]